VLVPVLYTRNPNLAARELPVILSMLYRAAVHWPLHRQGESWAEIGERVGSALEGRHGRPLLARAPRLPGGRPGEATTREGQSRDGGQDPGELRCVDAAHVLHRPIPLVVDRFVPVDPHGLALDDDNPDQLGFDPFAVVARIDVRACYISRIVASWTRGVPALAAAVVVVAFVAGSSAAWAERAAEGSAPTTKFVSKRYGYELVLSKAYDAYYAQSAWTGTFPDGLNPSVDTFVDWQQDRKFIVTAKRLSPGTTLGSWQTSMVARMQCAGKRLFRNSTLGGVPAREWVIACLSYDVIVLVAVHRGRGYIFLFVSPTSDAAASDRRLYDAGRRAFRFTSN
jgi:hypothetical protein